MATHPSTSPAHSPEPVFPAGGAANDSPVPQSVAKDTQPGQPETGEAPPSTFGSSAERAQTDFVNAGPIGARFQDLLKTVKANRPSEDLAPIRKAWEFCVHYHEGQLRASGEPYIIHPLEVAEVLAEMKLDATAIAAGLLHDAVEDTPCLLYTSPSPRD